MQELINACETTLLGKLSYIPSRLSNCSAIDCDRFILRKSPYNTSMFNIAWIKSVSQSELKEELSTVIKKFAPHPFALWLGPNSLPRISEKQLSDIGFVKEANEIGMILDLSTYVDNNQTLNALDIFEVKDRSGMEYFINVLEAYDSFVREYYLKVLDELGLDSHPFRFFCLCIDGKAACITSLFFNENYCGIFDVLTQEDHRNKGYASRLMKYVISYAKKHGSTYFCLTASSPEAVKLYSKIGFTKLGKYECYEFKSYEREKVVS